MIEVQNIKASLDFILMAESKTMPVVLSFFDRSPQVVRSIGAGLNYGGAVYVRKISYPKRTFIIPGGTGYDVYISPVSYGKERFFHGLAISKELNGKFLLSTREQMAEHFFNFLMRNFGLPLLREWSVPLMEHAIAEGHLKGEENPLLLGEHSISDSVPLGNEEIMLRDVEVISSCLTEETLEEAVSHLLKENAIRISPNAQQPLEFTGMDSYFAQYGNALVGNLERQIQPLTQLDGNISNMCLKSKRLFPQQAAQVNAVVKRLQNAPYCILNNGMGTGKTLEAMSVCEAYHVERWLRSHPGRSLRDAYESPCNINYRAIVMCPGHLVQKWSEEIQKEIPYAKVTTLSSVSQLIHLKRRGIKREGREFFVISKDFAKLSYQLKPLPYARRKGRLMKKKCSSCGKELFSPDLICPCGSRQIGLVPSDVHADAMACPFCKNLLVPYKNNRFTAEQPVLDFREFSAATSVNANCYYCGEPLWAPYVPNIGESRHNVWYRATHYTNKAHKGTKTVWVHRKYSDAYFEQIGEQPLKVIDAETHFGIRRVAPAYFIKRQLKGYFDFAIFDEAHLYKGAGTAQGNAMHALIKASRKQLALTGTIAGGYASHLFYLLYRLDPGKMYGKGYKWNDVMKFIDKYGKKEAIYECLDSSDGIHNTTSKGRQIAAPKEKPGISPLIFTDFLLDSAVFLDLSDMSQYLPPLKEYVETIDVPRSTRDSAGLSIPNPEQEMLSHYGHILDILKTATRKGNGYSLMSSMLQFALSYLDHPYDVGEIRNPMNGCAIVKPESFDMFKDPDTLLSKEKRLIELINREQKEGRNCFVYAEYTGNPSTCVSHRLKAIIERHCGLEGKVTILESAFPTATERESWMHKKAAEGIKVFITNPKNVETGLDFCFKKNGVLYNYPTLIFYQLGYSLFTIWQASRRHYRLNQREECRTYFMAVTKTVQEAVIGLVAQKMAATSAIQGKFSVEGLSAMAQGVDVKLKLAQSLSSMDNRSGADLQAMFDVLQADKDTDSMYGKYRVMLTLHELIGSLTEPAGDSGGGEVIDLLDIFGMFGEGGDDFIPHEPSSAIAAGLEPPSVFSEQDPFAPARKSYRKIPAGQISLFGF